jgi:hypothetical protein
MSAALAPGLGIVVGVGELRTPAAALPVTIRPITKASVALRPKRHHDRALWSTTLTNCRRAAWCRAVGMERSAGI